MGRKKKKKERRTSQLTSLEYVSQISRGILPIACIESLHTDKQFYDNIESILGNYLQQELIDDKTEDILLKIGGFTLIYGQLKLDECTNKVQPLNVMSNRRKYFKIFDPASEDPVEKKTTFALSNTSCDNPWPKVTQAEKSLETLLSDLVLTKASLEEVVSKCFSLLFTNTYSENIKKHGTSTEKMNELKNSIFIPSLQLEVPEKDSDACGTFSYGTRTLTMVVLDKNNNIHYYEKDIRDPGSDVDPVYIPTSEFELPLRTLTK